MDARFCRAMRRKATSRPHRPWRARGSLTTQRSHRLVSLAVRRVTLAGAMSGGAWRVWIFLEGWLGGLVPTMFTWRMRKLSRGGREGGRKGEGRPQGRAHRRVGSPSPPRPIPVVGEGVEVGHLHGAGVGLVGELVDQLPLVSLPDHAHLQRETPLEPASPPG